MRHHDLAKQSGERRLPDYLPYLLIAPIGLLMMVITVYPTIEAVHFAMTDATLLRLARAQFVWFRNFQRLIRDTTFLDGIWRTLRWDMVVVGLEASSVYADRTVPEPQIPRPRFVADGGDDPLHHATTRGRWATISLHVQRQFRRDQRFARSHRDPGSLRRLVQR